MKWAVFLAALLPWALLPCQAEDPVPLYIPWFYGAPYTASYIGEGETITWQWKDAGSYSVEGDAAAATVFVGKGGGASVVSQVNFTYKVTFKTPGSYEYHCHNHPYVMAGKVVVKQKFNFGGVTLPWFLGISSGGASAIIQEGDTVTWAWGDDLPHALTALNGDQTVFSGPGSNNDTVSGDGTFFYKKKFTKAGVYLYKCQNHGSQMFGNITVLPKDGGFSIQPVPTSSTPLGSTKEKTKAKSPPPRPANTTQSKNTTAPKAPPQQGKNSTAPKPPATKGKNSTATPAQPKAPATPPGKKTSVPPAPGGKGKNTTATTPPPKAPAKKGKSPPPVKKSRKLF